ncbi:MAG: cysteine hydrolase family protein [Pseudorhodoplanes sp.]
MTGSFLLVLDMTNDFVNANRPAAQGPIPFAAACDEAVRRGIVRATAQAIARARDAKVPIGYVRVGFSPDYRECSRQSPMFRKLIGTTILQLGTWGTEVHPDLAPKPGDYDIVKHRVSPFYATKLEPILRTLRVSRLYLCGVSTTGAVQSAVKEGHDRDYECVLIEDCCAASSQDEHDSAVAGMSRYLSAIATAASVNFHSVNSE